MTSPTPTPQRSHHVFRPHRVRVLAGAACLVALVGAGCSSGAGDQQSVLGSSSPRLGTDEFYKITMVIRNTTNLTWEPVASELGHDGTDGGGWDQRPSTVSPGQSETVSAYSAVQGQGIRVTLQAQEAHQLQLVLVAQDPWAGSNNTNGTKGMAPIVVNASITSGRQTTATFALTGSH